MASGNGVTTNSRKSLPQFGLSKVLLLVAVVALSIGTFGPFGVVVVLFVGVLAVSRRNAYERVSIVAFLAALFLFISCTLHGHREAARNAVCRNNLKQIAMALHNYHDNYGQFPPQFVADAKGRPMHSWRVLILPYLSDPRAEKIYQEYRFDEPWDSQHNQKLANRACTWFRCFTTDDAEPYTPWNTHYVAAVGPSTVWPGQTTRRLSGIVDRTSYTILLVEIADSDIHWMEPRDLPLEQALAGEDGESGVPSSHHFVERMYFFFNTYPLAGNTAMVDGSSRGFHNRPSTEDMAAMLSIDGGEPINESLFEWHRQTLLQRLDIKRCLSFALLVIFFVLLIW